MASESVKVKVECPIHGLVGETHDCNPGVGHKCYQCVPPRDATVVITND